MDTYGENDDLGPFSGYGTDWGDYDALSPPTLSSSIPYTDDDWGYGDEDDQGANDALSPPTSYSPKPYTGVMDDEG